MNHSDFQRVVFSNRLFQTISKFLNITVDTTAFVYFFSKFPNKLILNLSLKKSRLLSILQLYSFFYILFHFMQKLSEFLEMFKSNQTYIDCKYHTVRSIFLDYRNCYYNNRNVLYIDYSRLVGMDYKQNQQVRRAISVGLVEDKLVLVLVRKRPVPQIRLPVPVLLQKND